MSIINEINHNRSWLEDFNYSFNFPLFTVTLVESLSSFHCLNLFSFISFDDGIIVTRDIFNFFRQINLLLDFACSHSNKCQLIVCITWVDSVKNLSRQVKIFAFFVLAKNENISNYFYLVLSLSFMITTLSKEKIHRQKKWRSRSDIFSNYLFYHFHFVRNFIVKISKIRKKYLNKNFHTLREWDGKF